MVMATRTDLVKLVEEIMSTSACRIDFDSLLRRVESHSGGVDVAKLIFDPPDGKSLTAEEIVDRFLQK